MVKNLKSRLIKCKLSFHVYLILSHISIKFFAKKRDRDHRVLLPVRETLVDDFLHPSHGLARRTNNNENRPVPVGAPIHIWELKEKEKNQNFCDFAENVVGFENGIFAQQIFLFPNNRTTTLTSQQIDLFVRANDAVENYRISLRSFRPDQLASETEFALR